MMKRKDADFERRALECRKRRGKDQKDEKEWRR